MDFPFSRALFGSSLSCQLEPAGSLAHSITRPLPCKPWGELCRASHGHQDHRGQGSGTDEGLHHELRRLFLTGCAAPSPQPCNLSAARVERMSLKARGVLEPSFHFGFLGCF